MLSIVVWPADQVEILSEAWVNSLSPIWCETDKSVSVWFCDPDKNFKVVIVQFLYRGTVKKYIAFIFFKSNLASAAVSYEIFGVWCIFLLFIGQQLNFVFFWLRKKDKEKQE